MNRKGISPGIMIAVLVGLFFIGIVVVGFGPKILSYANEKFFGGYLAPKLPTPPGTVTGPSANIVILSNNHAAAVKELVDASLTCWQSWQSGYKGVCAEVNGLRLSSEIPSDAFVNALYSSSDIRGPYIVQNYAYSWNIGKLDTSAKFYICVVTRHPVPLSGPSGVLLFTRDKSACTV